MCDEDTSSVCRCVKLPYIIFQILEFRFFSLTPSYLYLYFSLTLTPYPFLPLLSTYLSIFLSIFLSIHLSLLPISVLPSLFHSSLATPPPPPYLLSCFPSIPIHLQHSYLSDPVYVIY